MQEIVSLLEEYSVDKPVIEKIELPEEKKIHDEIIEKNLDENPKPANMVVKITEPIKMNVRTASDTAKLVMKKVVIVLEPKKFNGKKDKLKEAELELEERKKKEKILEEEKKKLDDKKEIDNKKIEITDPVGIKLNTHDVFTDDDEDEINGKVKEVDEIKINIPSDREVSIPTEIFIEEPKEEKTVDLFKETDPFLDDNEFEINDKTNDSSRFASPLPKISNIGTVKPNNMLSRVEDAVKENDNIILPTMGLTDTGKVDVPIVSENYIQ